MTCPSQDGARSNPFPPLFDSGHPIPGDTNTYMQLTCPEPGGHISTLVTIRRQMLDIRQLHDLAGLDTRPHQTLSLYLALDVPREARMQALGELVSNTRRKMNRNGSSQKWEDLAPDLQLARQYVEQMSKNLPYRGLALFSCAGQDFFSALTLPLSVRDRLEVGPTPYIRPLNALASDYGRTLAVILDSRSARVFLSLWGETSELTQARMEGEAAPAERNGDRGRTGDSHISRRADEATRGFYREVEQKLGELCKDHGCSSLVVGGPKAAVEAFVAQLGGQLAELLAGSFTCEVTASPGQVAQEVAQVQHQARQARQDRLLQSLIENLGPKGLATSGLNEVLASLYEGRVHTLLVSRGLDLPGGACPNCGRLRHVAGACPLCATEMTAVDDVVNLAVAQALESGAVVEEIDSQPRLREIGHIAALLRYA